MFRLSDPLINALEARCIPKNINLTSQTSVNAKLGSKFVDHTFLRQGIASLIATPLTEDNGKDWTFEGISCSLRIASRTDRLTLYVWLTAVMAFLNAARMLLAFKYDDNVASSAEQEFEDQLDIATNCFSWCSALGTTTNPWRPVPFTRYPSRGLMYLCHALRLMHYVNTELHIQVDNALLKNAAKIVSYMHHANETVKNNEGLLDIGHDVLTVMHVDTDTAKDIYLFYAILCSRYDKKTSEKNKLEASANMYYVINNKLHNRLPKDEIDSFRRQAHVISTKNNELSHHSIQANPRPSVIGSAVYYVIGFFYSIPEYTTGQDSDIERIRYNKNLFEEVSLVRTAEMTRFNYLDITFSVLTPDETKLYDYISFVDDYFVKYKNKK